MLFPPPSAFLSYAIESDFRVGFGGDAMTIPVAIVASALRVLAGLAIGFVAAIATGILISASKTVSDMVHAGGARARADRADRLDPARHRAVRHRQSDRRSSSCSWASISS